MHVNPTIPPPVFPNNTFGQFVFRFKGPDKWWCTRLDYIVSAPLTGPALCNAVKNHYSTWISQMHSDFTLYSIQCFYWLFTHITVQHEEIYNAAGTSGGESLPTSTGVSVSRLQEAFPAPRRTGRLILSGLSSDDTDASHLTPAAYATWATIGGLFLSDFTVSGSLFSPRFLNRARTVSRTITSVKVAQRLSYVHRRRPRGPEWNWFPAYPQIP
jgi:hypothetical protein